MPPIRRRLVVTLAGFGAAAGSRRLRRRAARRHRPTSRSRASSTARSRSPTTPTRRSSSSPGCRASLAAALVGASLAAAGVVFQALLRNPLATPDTLGVSSGAALGAMLAITFRLRFRVRRRRVDPARQLRRIDRRARHRLRAGLGAAARPVDDRAAAGRRHDDGVLPGADPVHAVPGRLRRHVPHRALADGVARRRQLRADRRPRCRSWSSRSRCWRRCRARWISISLGADAAAARGVNVLARRAARARQRVARDRAPPCRSAGPVGFIGLVVPHLVRLVVGSDHRLVLPASALFGAAFLIGCDRGRAHGLVVRSSCRSASSPRSSAARSSCGCS